MQNYTARKINRLTLEEILQLGDTMTEEELEYWSGWGYDGAVYVKLLKRTGTVQDLLDEDISLGAWCPTKPGAKLKGTSIL